MRVFIFSSAGIVSLVALMYGAWHFYLSEEADSQKQIVARCEIREIAKQLIREYEENGEYPRRLADSKGVRALEAGTVCVGPLEMSNSEYLDPWGRPYRLVESKGPVVLIYSESYSDGLGGENQPFRLEGNQLRH